MPEPGPEAPVSTEPIPRRASRFAVFALALSLIPPLILAITLVWPIVLRPDLSVGVVLGVLCPWSGAFALSAIGVPVTLVALLRVGLKPELRGKAVGATALVATVTSVMIGLTPLVLVAVLIALAIVLVIVGVFAAISWLGTMSVSGRPLGEPATRAWHHLADRQGIWAARAHDEARSVDAFLALARDLEHLGAPLELVQRARAAAADEARHARHASLRAGGVTLPDRLPLPEPLPRAEIARRSVLEGCIGEAFAAAVLRAEGEVSLAEDEAEHAALAWAIVDWAGPIDVRLPAWGWMPSDRVGLLAQLQLWRQVRRATRDRLRAPPRGPVAG